MLLAWMNLGSDSISCAHWKLLLHTLQYHWQRPRWFFCSLWVSLRGPASLFAHIERMTFYLIFEGGNFTKNDRLVTCNPISSGYSSHFPSSVQTFGNFWSKLMWACKLRTYITCAMGTASTCQYLHCFALVSCTSNGNYISMLHWHYNWSLMIRACRNLTHVDISPSSLSRLYFYPTVLHLATWRNNVCEPFDKFCL